MENENERIRSLRDILHLEILDNIEHVKLNGHREKRICNTLNMSFDNAEGESMVMNLDLEGIAVSTGSACSEGNVDPSHVLLAMGLTSDEAVSSLRFSLGRFFMEDDIEGIVENLKKVIFRIRNLKV